MSGTRLARLACLSLVFASPRPIAALQEHVHDAGPHNEVYKVGKNGDVKIGTDVKIGDVLVKEGKYLLAHRAEGDRHYLVLTRIDPKNRTEAPGYEIRTRLVPSAEPVKRSALFAYQLGDGSYRVAVVQIVGEDGDHLP